MLNRQLHTRASHEPGFLIANSFSEAEFKAIRLIVINNMIKGPGLT